MNQQLFFLLTVQTDQVTDMRDVYTGLLVINMSRVRGLYLELFAGLHVGMLFGRHCW